MVQEYGILCSMKQSINNLMFNGLIGVACWLSAANLIYVTINYMALSTLASVLAYILAGIGMLFGTYAFYKGVAQYIHESK